MIYKCLLALWIIIQICEQTGGTKQSRLLSSIRKDSPNTRNRRGNRDDDEVVIDGGQLIGNNNNDEPLNRLSRLFGISKIPRYFQKENPPEYMINLFNNVAYEDGITKQAAPYNANVVRGLPDKALRHQIHYKFNVSHITSSEQILGAEFHVFKLSPRSADWHRPGHVVLLKLYQILDPHATNDPLRHRLLLYQRRVSAHARGWEVFSVRHTVQQWISDGHSNHGFLLETWPVVNDEVQNPNTRHFTFAQRSQHHDSKQPLLVIFTEDDNKFFKDHLNNKEPESSTESEPQNNNNNNEQPNAEEEIPKIPSYNNSNNNNTTNTTTTGDLSALRRHYIRLLNENNRQTEPNTTPTPLGARSNKHMSAVLHSELSSISQEGEIRSRRKRGIDHNRLHHKRRKKPCSLHELYVDFEEIGWSSWIISPQGYNAYHCRGACQFPLGQNQQPTNHATVQSIVSAFRQGREVNEPCCVPNKLFSISLLYFDDQENVILKQYDDMVAAGCGCH